MRFLRWFGLGCAVLLIGTAAYTAWPRRNRVERLTITAGSAAGSRAKIAELLASSRELPFVSFDIKASRGSRDALDKVNAREIDLALVQGGLASGRMPNIRRVASLHVEPLHLLVRHGLHSEVSNHLLALKDKSINVSTVGSGTNALATELLSFLRLREGIDYRATHFDYEALTGARQADLPDAIFTVSSLPSPVATRLINEHDYQLIDLSFAESFQLHWLDAPRASEVNRRRISTASIPAFVYRVDPPSPSRPIVTFGTRLELVAHDAVPTQSITDICAAIYEFGVGQISNEVLRPELLRGESDIALHDGARIYIDRLEPVSTGRVIEVTEQLVGILGAALGGMLFFWQWLRRARERKRDTDFVGSVQRVVEIENSALGFEQDEAMTVQDLERLQNELGRIKTDLIQRYREGQLEGADMLSAFLKHANDASELISRIVLHESKPKSQSLNS